MGAKKHWLVFGLALGIAAALAGRGTLNYTSSDNFCNQACHAHPHADEQWVESAHYTNRRGVIVHCTDCHLPPGGVQYLMEKAKLGSRDAYAQLFRDVSKIDWARERRLDRVLAFTYDSACTNCHNNLFTPGLSKVTAPLPSGAQQSNSEQQQELRLVARRMEAHLYYQRNRNRLHCVNCHLFEGHPQKKTALLEAAVAESAQFPIAASGFQNYTEQLPGSDIRFHMIAVQAGTVEMGSPELGMCRARDTGPARSVSVKPFWMAQAPITIQELGVFGAHNKLAAKPGISAGAANGTAFVAAESAKAYVDWLSKATGKLYRLPSEAELEYACVADAGMPSWQESYSRVDPRLRVNPLNSWGFVDFPDGGELSSDYGTSTGTFSFRVVRDTEPSNPTHTASALPQGR